MFKYIDNRSHLKFNPYHLYDLSKGNSWLLQRMSLLRLLDIHRGCVNTISWGERGEIILSGSDDHHLTISNAFTGTVLSELHTSHRANIFSAKFLPNSGDGKIISCSGSGLVMYTDVEQHKDLERKFCFHCHEGTCFEVLTIPGCSNTFLSCGEDGTVRCVDLRIKSSCFQTNCKEDVLLSMGHAVTSMAVNDVKPFHLAVSTPDSTVRVYDRRMLDANSGESKGSSNEALLMRLIPSALDGKNRRATFIDFNSTGSQILASFSAENLYLFDLEDVEELASSCERDDSDYDESRGGPGPTLKRLRLRGDWSDTGPLAVPESELRFQAGDVGQARPTLHSTLMQRMTDVLSTMLQNPSVREAARIVARTRQGVNQHLYEAEIAMNDGSPPSEANSNEDHMEDMDSPSRMFVGDGPDLDASEQSEFGLGEQPHLGSVERPDLDLGEGSDLGASGIDPVSFSDENDGQKEDLQSQATPMEPTVETAACSTSMSANLPDCSETTEEPDRTAGRASPDQDFSPMQTDANDSKDAQSPYNLSNNTSGAGLSNVSDETESVPGENNSESASYWPRPSTSNTWPASSPVASTTNTDSEEPTPKGRQRSIASQRMTRAIEKVVLSVRKREAKKMETLFRKIPFGKEIRHYKGHRNARTMIREACFWGKDHVMSGSDCGRVFVWEKNTGRLAMLWEADRHVVNCLQPHPTLPVLATCGIDYDVKVWAPICEEPNFDEMQSLNIIQRNDAIQDEMRDTVTVPAAFMIRMLASLNQIRQDRTRQRETSDE